MTRTTSAESPNPLAGGALASTVSGTLATAGFTTVHLPKAVKIADGTNFAIVFEQTGTRHPHLFCCSDTNDDGSYYAKVDVKAGNTYWGKVASGATNWTDLATEDGIACLKAYTRSTVAVADAPAESDDGTAALAWLATTNATLYAETSETLVRLPGWSVRTGALSMRAGSPVSTRPMLRTASLWFRSQ